LRIDLNVVLELAVLTIIYRYNYYLNLFLIINTKSYWAHAAK